MGEGELASTEGTTLEDLLVMAMYALAAIPSIKWVIAFSACLVEEFFLCWPKLFLLMHQKLFDCETSPSTCCTISFYW